MPGNTIIPMGGIFYTPSASFDKVQVAGTVVVDSARTGIFTNLYSANALQTTNVFVSNGLDVGPGTLGSNVVVFSNISGGSNVFVMDSNGRIGIGTVTPIFPLTVITSSSTGTGATLGAFGTSAETRVRFLDENNSTFSPPGILSHNTGYGLGLYTNYGDLLYVFLPAVWYLRTNE
jgi:hypothetical protein